MNKFYYTKILQCELKSLSLKHNPSQNVRKVKTISTQPDYLNLWQDILCTISRYHNCFTNYLFYLYLFYYWLVLRIADQLITLSGSQKKLFSSKHFQKLKLATLIIQSFVELTFFNDGWTILDTLDWLKKLEFIFKGI